MARKKKIFTGRKEINPNLISSEMVTYNMASCSQLTCGHVHLQLGEIKNELKGLKNMVDFAVKLLTKLVPASIDDFQNILNGSTGLTITTVPPVVTNEADRLEIEAVEERMEIEQNNVEMQEVESHNESPSVIVQIDSCPPSPKQNASCTVETETTTVASEIMPSGVENTKLNSDVKVNSSFESTKTEDVHPVLKCANLEISLQNVWSKNESADALPGSENVETVVSHIPDTKFQTSDVDPLIVTDKIETNPFNHFHILAQALQEQLSSSVNENTGLNCSAENESDHRTMIDMKSEQRQTNCDSEQFSLDNSSQTSSFPLTDSVSNSVPAISHIEISTSNTEKDLLMVVKKELSSEYDDTEPRLQNSDEVRIEPEGVFVSGLIPECVFIKNEDEENNHGVDANNILHENNKYQIFREYNSPAAEEFNMHELGHGVSHSQQILKNQIPSPLKPLSGSALVSKMKQKIQEKIQAAVGTSNEEKNIIESENDLINTKSCINLSLAFNDDCENSKQIMVAESKLRPKFYQCKSCAKIFFCTIALHAHKNNCSGLRKQFRCNSCPLIFKSRTVLCNHRRLHAKKIAKTRHKCDSCGREFILKTALKKHRQSQICAGTRMKCYKKLPQYFCIECGEGFLNVGNLALHQKLHAVDKNITDNNVKNTGMKKQNLPVMQTNKATRRYPCGYCDEAFIDKRSVTLHEKLHTDKEFAAFDQERRLIQRRHQLMLMMQKQQQKTSEKKYGCNVCGRCYPIELLLDMHTRLHHAIS